MLPRSDVPLSCWQLQCSRVADFRPGEDLSVLKWKKRATRIKIISFDLLNADFRHIYVHKSFEFLVPTFISWRSRSSRRRWRKDLLKSWGDGRCHGSSRSRIDLEKIKSLLFFIHITLRLTTMGQTWLSDAVSNLRNRFSFLFSWTI